MIIYELGLPGGFWADFEATLKRMESEDHAAKEQAELQKRQLALKKQNAMNAVIDKIVYVAAIILVITYLSFLLWAIQLHRENQLRFWWV